MKPRQIVLATVLAGAIGAGLETSAADNGTALRAAPAAARLPIEGKLPSFGGATTWLNSRPLTAADLRGKVVLVDFWTYTCINWLRSYPYVRAWAEKYRDQGLVAIGVHTPEFSFEKNLDNIRRAVTERKLDYPVAVDSDHAVWDAFKNLYWPAIYLIDAHGRIRYHAFGEGDYEQTEKAIQQLLAEAGHEGVGRDVVAIDPHGIEAAADWTDLQSPETYVGYAQAEGFTSPGGAALNKPHLYTGPADLARNHWTLSGDWTVEREAAVLNKADGRIVYRFHARDLHLVLAPAAQGQPVRFRVRLDGGAPGASHGSDVDAEGLGTIDAARTYQLVRQSGSVADRTFEIEFLDPGVRAYAFTFG